MKVLLLEPIGGISGDMTAAALVALGASLERMQAGLAAVGLDEVRLGTEAAARHHLQGTRFLVQHKDGTPADTHAHATDGHSGHGGHDHRAWRDIRAMLEAAGLTPGAKDAALRIFEALALAEGEVHGVAPEAVTFHEVGAWDSIADIVCTAIGLDELRPDAVFCTPIPLGSGSVKTAHGLMPIPTPATLLLLKGFPVIQGGPAFERTTPTGAAVLAALARPAPDPFAFRPERVGIGVGSRDDPEVPNILRAVLGESASEGTSGDVVEVAEANLDDANPEWIGYLMERLFEDGALDVSLLPIQMKKNRPGTLVQVMYPPELRDKITSRIFSEVTTLGVRYRRMERALAERKSASVPTPWGEVTGKVARYGAAQHFAPEFESCRAVALREGVPLREVYRAALLAWREDIP